MAAAQQVAAQQAAAMPDLAAAYASDDPYKWVSENPNASPVARWAILRSTPEEVAQAKNIMAESALRRAQLPLASARGTAISAGLPGLTTPATTPTLPPVGGGVGAAGGGVAAPIRTAGAAGTDPTAGIPLIQGAGPPADPLSGMPAAGAGRLAWLQKQPVAVQRLAIARMRGAQ
jgi:hypothetical protein